MEIIIIKCSLRMFKFYHLICVLQFQWDQYNTAAKPSDLNCGTGIVFSNPTATPLKDKSYIYNQCMVYIMYNYNLTGEMIRCPIPSIQPNIKSNKIQT